MDISIMGKGRAHIVLSLGILLARCACSFASDHSVKADFPAGREGRADSTPRHFQNIQAQGGHAPGRDLKFTHLTTDDGLSDNRINSILQDRRGFMWFATENGLNRYDGNTFAVYKNNPDDPNTLTASLIQSLIEDSHGNLWIGTWGGLDKLDPTTERFTHYRHNPDNPNSISGDAIKSIAQDSSGHLWVGTVDDGLNKFDPATETFTRYRNDSDGQFVGEINSIIEDSHLGIWFAGPRGLFHLSPQTGQITRLPATIDRLAADYLHEDKAGNLWMLAYSPVALLVKYDRRAEGFTAYPFGEGAVGIPLSNILEDGQNGLWVASSRGLYHFDLQTERFAYRLQHDGTNPDSLDDNSVSSIYRDQAGLLWVGTETGGLNILDLRQGRFGSYPHRPGNPGSLSPGLVTAMHQDRNDILWAGFTPFALDRLDRKTRQITHYLPGSGNKNALGKGGNLNGIDRDAQGYLWLSGWGVLDRFDERSGQFRHYRHKPDDPNSLLSLEILCIYEDRSGRLWVGQVGGLSRFDPATEKFINYRNNPADPASLGSNGVNAIYQDRYGTLWFGSWKGTLSRFDDKTNTFVNLRADSRDPHKLSGSRIHAIHEDQTGTLWLGTADGLYRYNRENETFTHYTENQGLPSGVIQCILDDRSGRLWLGTKKGISRFDPHNETFRNYDVFDGLQSNEFSEGCYEDRQSGEMFFGGNDGITAFFPENIRDNPDVPRVAITSFKIFNKPVPIGAKSVLKKAISYIDSLTLSYRDNVFSFEFAALSYANSQKNRYRYKLEPLEPGWNEVGSKQRLATYTNLDPGKYVFRVLGSNSDGVWNEEGVSLPILITPPWWRTNWFRALCTLTFLAMLWTVYQVRVHSFRQRQALLERNQEFLEQHQAVLEQHQTEIRALNEQMIKAQEAERMRIAGELHDSVLQQITSLTLRLGSVKRKVPPDSEAKVTVNHLQQELIQIGTDIRHISHELHPALLHEKGLPAALTVYCEEFSKVRGLPVSCEADESVKDLSPGAALCLYRIAQEALGNAAKHSAAKKVEVRLTRSDGSVCLSVSDDGVGCAPEQIGKSRGLGVINMRERVLQLIGTFEFDSKLGQGTRVTVTVPFRPATQVLGQPSC